LPGPCPPSRYDVTVRSIYQRDRQPENQGVDDRDVDDVDDDQNNRDNTIKT